MKRALIAIADAARARIYTYQQDGANQDLVEVVDLVQPGRHANPRDTVSDPRAGSFHGIQQHGGSAMDDHRDQRAQQHDLDFAKQVVAELERLASAEGYRHIIVAASPNMLGDLRKHDGHLRKTPDLVIDEVARDLTKLAPAQVHDHLSALDLLPARVRLAKAARG